MLEPPCRGVSNEYPQSMFLTTNKKYRYAHANPRSSTYIWGFRERTFHGHVFLDELACLALVGNETQDWSVEKSPNRFNSYIQFVHLSCNPSDNINNNIGHKFFKLCSVKHLPFL